jgi:hypothetical protein
MDNNYFVGHPRALDFEVSTSHSANKRCQIRLGVDHLDNVSYRYDEINSRSRTEAMDVPFEFPRAAR